MEEEEQVLSSLGASAVECGTFEQKVVDAYTTYLNSQKELAEKYKKGVQKKKVSAPQKSSLDSSKPSSSKKQTESSSLNHDVLFPKKRKKKPVLGTVRRSGVASLEPGTLPSENTSIYINPEEDSDYEPPAGFGGSDDEWHPEEEVKRIKKVRPQKQNRKKRKISYQEPNTDDSDLSGEEIKKPSKRLRKEVDDGDFKYYEQRVREWKEKEVRFSGNFHEVDGGLKVPKYIWENLYDYQQTGVKWLWELHQKNCGGILGDEMGLGKTIQVIAFLAGVSCSNLLFRFAKFRGLGPTLIVCPATIMHQWVTHFHAWWPPFRVVILHESGSYSGSKSGLIRSVAANNGILITSYVGVVNSQSEILKHTWHYVILDEGHKIRNPDAQVTLTVKQIPTAHRLILSGSPLQNNLKELWSLFDFIFPGKLGTLPAFMEQFSVPITQGGYANASDIQVATAFKCATILRNIINPYLLRRMKSDVKQSISLPPKSEQVLFCKLAPEQKACYINYVNSKEIDSIIQGRFNLFVGLINLRKICNHPHLFDGGPKLFSSKSTKIKKDRVPKVKSHMMSGAAASSSLPNSYHSLNAYVSEPEESDSDIDLDPNDSFGEWTKSGKMIVLETLLRLWKRQNHKVLLFSQSRQMLCILENFVRQQNYLYLKLDGGTTIGARQPLIKKFNEDPSIFVFILTTRVGGLGINLTGANRVIIFDPDWNPAVDLQARERAWRIGQGKQVTIYRLITAGTIEEKIYHRQIFKQFLTNRVLKDPKQKRFFKSNDMLELFSFNEGIEKGNESEAIFAGTNSSVDVRSLKRLKRATVTEAEDSTLEPGEIREEINPREKSSGRFKDIPNLVKQRTYNQKQELDTEAEQQKTTNNDEDDYVLRKLFRKSGVEAALKHDKIVESNEHDYLLVEKEAERVAADAVKVLQKSREQCWAADTGRVTWTGHNGILREALTKRKPRFGGKKSVTATVTKPSVPEPDEKLSYFSGPTTSSSLANEYEPTSSADLIAAIKARKRSILPEPVPQPNDVADAPNITGTNNAEHLDHVNPAHVEMLREIREFLAFRAAVDGQASTTEILIEFGSKLPTKDSPLFKQMLTQLCTLRKVDGKGIWRLKPEFR